MFHVSFSKQLGTYLNAELFLLDTAASSLNLQKIPGLLSLLRKKFSYLFESGGI